MEDNVSSESRKSSLVAKFLSRRSDKLADPLVIAFGGTKLCYSLTILTFDDDRQCPAEKRGIDMNTWLLLFEELAGFQLRQRARVVLLP